MTYRSGPDGIQSRGGGWIWLVGTAVVAGSILLIGGLASQGAWLPAAGAMVAIPAGLVLYRHPMVMLSLWLLIDPLVVNVSAGGVARRVFWLFHRGLPLLTLIVIVVALAVRGRFRRRPMRLGLPELFMALYLVLSLVSIWYTNLTPLATTYLLYDRVVVPMIIYLAIRLHPPRRSEIEAAAPILMIVLVLQSIFAVIGWISPGSLPAAWQDRVTERTVGSLNHPNVYGTTVLILGSWLLILSSIREGMSGTRRNLYRAMFVLGLVMAFMTMSRATWLAAILVVIVLLRRLPGTMAWMAGLLAVVIMAVAASGLIAPIVDRAQTRFFSEQSEESALSRLPVVQASVRMLAEKPVTGWGFGNFDRYDILFVTSVGDLFVPDKDHASHNLYLTILAEQGLPGFLTYMAPALILLFRTPRALRLMRVDPYGTNPNLLIGLWLLPLAQAVTNNFSNMRVPFGLGLWWMSLALIANVIADARATETRYPERVRDLMVATGLEHPRAHL
jgi:O-antigen ligase